MKRFGDGKNYITVQFGKVKNVDLIVISEKKESGFFYFILFLAIIESSLANITLCGQNIDNSHILPKQVKGLQISGCKYV